MQLRLILDSGRITIQQFITQNHKRMLQISAVALAAISTIVAPYVIRAKAPIISNIVILSGMLTFAGTLLYGIHKLFRGDKTVQPRQQEPFTFTSGPACLKAAMKLFENEDLDLLKRYENHDSLSSILQECVESYPEGAAKAGLQDILTVQKALENPKVNLQTLLDERQDKPLYLFVPKKQNQKTELVLIQLPQAERFSTLKLLQDHYVYKDELPDYLDRFTIEAWQEKQLSLKKTLSLTMRHFEADKAKQNKAPLYTNLLFKVLKSYPNWTKDPAYLAWISSSLVKLKNLHPDPSVASKLSTLEQEVLSHKQSLRLVTRATPPFKALAISNFQLAEAVSFLGTKEAKSATLDVHGSKSAERVSRASYPKFEKKKDLQSVAKWKGYFQNLFQCDEFERAESEISSFLNALPRKKLEPFISMLQEKEKEQFARDLFDIAQLLATLHFVDGVKICHPSRFAALLRAIETMQCLCKKIKSNFFDDFGFNCDDLYHATKDHYFDVGPYQASIRTSLEAIRGNNRKKELLPTCIFYKQQHEHLYKQQHEHFATLQARWYFQSMENRELNRNQGNHGTDEESAAIKETNVPQSLVDISQLILLTHIVVEPHEHFMFSEKPLRDRAEFNERMQTLKMTLHPASNKIKNQKALLLIHGSHNGALKVEPFGIGYSPVMYQSYLDDMIKMYQCITYDNQRSSIQIKDHLCEQLGAPYSFYYEQGGPIKNPDIRKRLAEGIVANATRGPINEDGDIEFQTGKSIKDRKFEVPGPRDPTGLKQTVFQIHQDKWKFPELSLEASRDLQKMQSSHEQRASSTIYTFSKYPYLFSLPQYGEDWQKVFRLNLFTGNALVREFEAYPETAPLLMRKLDELLHSREKAGDIQAWLFLYKVRADIAKIRQEKMPKELSSKLENWIARAERNEELYKAKRQHLHEAYLYTYALDLPTEQKEIMRAAKSLFLLRSFIESNQCKNSREGRQLRDLKSELLPDVIDIVDKDFAQIDELISYSFQRLQSPRKWTRIAKGVYESPGLKVDLNTGQAIAGSKMEGALPREISQNERYMALFGKKILSGIFEFTCYDTSKGKLWATSIRKDGVDYLLYLPNKTQRTPLIFRQKEIGRWQLLQWQVSNIQSNVPEDFFKAYFWNENGNYTIEDAQGNRVYEASLSGSNISKLYRLQDGRKHLVLALPADSGLTRLGDPADILVTEVDNVPRIQYLKGKNSFIWDTKKRHWKSLIHRGYFLSEKPIEEWIYSVYQGSDKKQRQLCFFASHFTNYQVLENKAGKAKLVLACNAYQKKDKRSLLCEPKRDKVGIDHFATFSVFDLEKNGHVKSKNPLDLFNLAYTLFTQGKYDDAKLYLQQSKGIWIAHNENERKIRDTIKQWFVDFPDNTPNGLALKTHVLLQEYKQRDHAQQDAEAILARDAQFLPQLLESAERYVESKSKVDLSLRLPVTFEKDLCYLAPRAVQWVREKIEKKEKSIFITDDVIEFYEKNSTMEPKECLNWALDRHIAYQESFSLQKIPRSHTQQQFEPKPLLDLSPWLICLKDDLCHNAVQKRVHNFIAELKSLFGANATLADSIGLGVAEDLKYYAEKRASEQTLSPRADLAKLLHVLDEKEKSHVLIEKEKKQQILSSFCLPLLDPKESIIRQLEERDELQNSLFEQARAAFGQDDFSKLIASGAIEKSKVANLKKAMQNYLITRTERQQFCRKKEVLSKLIKKPNDAILREECSVMLQEWRNYDPEKHAFGSILLLMEDELNITARASQIEHIDKIIANPDAYIHEAMAGGKTTFLRNAFTAIQAKYGYLGGVMTYAPLMAMHHKEYAHVNNAAFGVDAYPFYFTRETPRDAATIKLMILHHMEALNHHGKVDQTPAATISVKHSLSELVLLLREVDPKTVEEITPSIHALQKLIALRARDLSLYADEMDKIFDALKDFNYSVTGSKQVLQAKDYKPALTIMKCLQTSEKLKHFRHSLKSNLLKEMPQDQFEKELRTLAEVLYDSKKFPTKRETTINYLIEAHQEDHKKQSDVVKFYEQEIQKIPDQNVREELQVYHYYLGILLRNMKEKVAGVHFGRSADGILVKPYAFSAVCQESSQRSFVLATVMEICFDYMVYGMNPKSTQSYVEKCRQKAEKQLDQSSHLKDIETAPAARQFFSRFGVQLSRVCENDYTLIAKKVEADSSIQEECIEEILLKDFVFYTQKLEGNSHHIPHLVAAFSGSSGSPERVKTLPGMIHKIPELIRQKGAIGSVFYSLLKDFDEAKDIIPLKENEPINTVLSKLLEPGDALVDNAPFFPNMVGSKIVESLASQSHNKLYRCLDAQDDVVIWENGQTRKGDAGVNLDKVISIIDHKAKQGTNLVFAPGKKGIVELDIDTELTTFYQSLMRFRLLGKGYVAKILYKMALHRMWSKEAILKDKGLLAKALWTLVHNEESLVKKLHFQANHKAIRAIRTAVVDHILQKMQDIHSLKTIAKLEGDDAEVKSALGMISKTPISYDTLGAPVVLKKPVEELRELVANEVKTLDTLHMSLSKMNLPDQDLATCLTIIEKGKGMLTDPSMIMDEGDLPNMIPTPQIDSEGTEEIEVEVDQQAQVQQEALAEAQIETQTDIEFDAQDATIIEIEPPTKHPRTSEGTEWPDDAIPKGGFIEYILSEGQEKYPFNHYLDHDLFPNIWISAHGLGYLEAPSQGGGTPDNWRSRLWLYSKPKKQAQFGSKVFVVARPDGKIGCQMASIKEADFHFTDWMKLRDVGVSWIDAPPNERDSEKLNKMPSAQRSMQASDNPNKNSIYSDNEKYLKELAGMNFYKFDLNETYTEAKLSFINPKFRKEIMKRLAIMKVLYVEGSFSQEEKVIVQDWLKQFPVPQAILKERLTSYLRQFFPHTAATNELLTLIG